MATKKTETKPVAETEQQEQTAETGTALAVQTGPGALALPDDLAGMLIEDAGQGAEGINNEDRQIPFLRIIQSLSPQRQRNKPEYIEGVMEGEIVNTVTSEVFDGEREGIYFIPVSYRRSHTEWWPRGSKHGEGLVKDWGTDASILDRCTPNDKKKMITPEGTEVIVAGEYFGFRVDPNGGAFEPVVINMAGTQLRTSRQWNTRLTTERVNVGGRMIQPPLFFRIWHLTTVQQSNDEGAWFGWAIKPHKNLFETPFGNYLYQEARAFGKKVERGEVKTQAPVSETVLQGEVVDGEGGKTPPEDIPF